MALLLTTVLAMYDLGTRGNGGGRGIIGVSGMGCHVACGKGVMPSAAAIPCGC